MKTSGVIYLQIGIKCIPRLLVSISSLRRHYSGPVHVVLIGEQVSWLEEALQLVGAKFSTHKPRPEVSNPLCYKAALNDYTPFDVSLFLDADTLVVGPIDALFAEIEASGMIFTQFSNWTTATRAIRSRIEACNNVAPDDVKSTLMEVRPALNTGVFGFVKDHPIFTDWYLLSLKIATVAHFAGKICDEVAAQLLYWSYGAKVLDDKWNRSLHYSQTQNPAIIHYHGRKHVRIKFPTCQFWLREYWRLIRRMPAHIVTGINSCKDRRLAQYLHSLPDDITLVTAVDDNYIEQLRDSLPSWDSTWGLVSLPMLCFVNGIDLSSSRLDFLRERKAELVSWDLPGACSQREKMLSAFVLGAAKHVKTPYWVKIDCDQKLDVSLKRAFVLDLGDYRNFDLMTKRWGYTKPGAWLRTLEEWAATRPEFAGTKPLFTPEQLAEADVKFRYRHPRIISKICCHNSAFVRKCAAMCPDRLPVPSHDTYLWYCATRLKAKIGFEAQFHKIGE